MVVPPPVGEQEQDKRIQGLSTAFARECGALGIPYIDLFSVLSLDDTYKAKFLAMMVLIQKVPVI